MCRSLLCGVHVIKENIIHLLTLCVSGSAGTLRTSTLYEVCGVLSFKARECVTSV